MAHRNRLHARLREFSAQLPGAQEDFPWGRPAMKVNGKVFVFLGPTDGAERVIGVKLDESREQALAVDGATPGRHNLGPHGWVTIPLHDGMSYEILTDWVVESYRNIASKHLVRELDKRAGG
ncbi:MmcQ/YjbR family DNA-binding protein [Nocardia brasiliensis]|uniref:MmcQ/YjbR family DNA-binding protein n=1 Tax=Nocardia brasiliensis TaxID=37326 RepID=UPI00366D093A